MLMRKIVLSLIIVLFAQTSNSKIYIPLVKSVPPSTNNGGDARVGERSSSHVPMAYFEEDTLYIQYPLKTVTSVIITNDSTDAEVLRVNHMMETTGITVPIGSLPMNKQYNLSVNAYGIWWVGYFEYMPSTINQRYQRYISAIVDNPNSERNYGIYLDVGNAASGWNYGVSGILSGQNGGTGIYGSSQSDEGFNTGGRFAGLFHGDLKTTDAVYASVYNTLADSRLHMNSSQVEKGSLEKLMQMSVFKYGLKQFNVDNGDGTTSLGYYNDDSGILEKEHFGLSGQEIKEIYPNLVSENQEGYLSVNYMEIVPLLIQSIQELKQELDAIKTVGKVQERESFHNAVLFQNAPNPFSSQSIVKCIIPEDVKYASLYLYDYNGRQIKSRIITERGNVQIAIDGNELTPGIYLYSLITDGEMIDTKRMVYVSE